MNAKVFGDLSSQAQILQFEFNKKQQNLRQTFGVINTDEGENSSHNDSVVIQSDPQSE